MKINISLQKKQRLALETSKKFTYTFFGGAKGGGKSWLVRAREFLRRLKYPNTSGVIIRKTYEELRANHIHQFFNEYPITRQWYNKSEKTIYYPNGSTTSFKYLRRTDDVYNFQGLEFDDISLDEATQHEEVVFKTLSSSLRTTKDIDPRFFLTGNPGGIGHGWVKRIFIDRQFKPEENPKDYAFIPAKVFDNQILLENDPAYLGRLKALPERLRRAYLDGDWNIFAGLAFDELDSIHLVKPFRLPENTRFISGYDYGYAHPFAWVLVAITPDKKVYIVDYLKKNKKRPDEQAKMIIEKLDHWSLDHCYVFAGTDIWANREGRSTIYEQLSDGVGERATFLKAKTNRHARVAEIRKLIAWRNTQSGDPILRFFENTYPVFEQIKSMQFDEKDPEDVIKMNADEDGNGGDDLYDATSYVLMQWLTPNPKMVEPIKPNTGAELMEFVKMKQRIKQWV